VAAQHDLHAATRAQEQAPWSIHAHPGREPKLQCWTDASQRCHTDVAPPSSARCRARYGCQASRRDRPLPRPPSSA
jgi:GH25 family lysozyme M1 (1,4-beta-N-acetylmuramidase)